MNGKTTIYNPADSAFDLAVRAARAREVVTNARELLLEASPDTFLRRPNRPFVSLPREPATPTPYRAYILDNHGHIFNFVELQARDDAEAKWEASRLRDGFDIEVWKLSRKVAFIKAER